jgi:hypothetical protein
MNTNRTLSHTLFLLFLAVCAWLGVILQFVTIVPDWLQQGKTMSDSLIQFFSYFTILTNLMIAITSTAALLLPRSELGGFCAKPATITAVNLYIIVVGLVYNLVLRPLYSPHGWGRVADEIVHSVVPLLYVIYWLSFSAKGAVKWKNAINWLFYPLVYLVYTFGHGIISNYYPYPFMDVKVIGYTGFWLNSFYLLLLFLLLSIVLIGIDKLLAKRKDKQLIAA